MIKIEDWRLKIEEEDDDEVRGMWVIQFWNLGRVHDEEEDKDDERGICVFIISFLGIFVGFYNNIVENYVTKWLTTLYIRVIVIGKLQLLRKNNNFYVFCFFAYFVSTYLFIFK